jgi:hypothetical protein
MMQEALSLMKLKMIEDKQERIILTMIHMKKLNT